MTVSLFGNDSLNAPNETPDSSDFIPELDLALFQLLSPTASPVCCSRPSPPADYPFVRYSANNPNCILKCSTVPVALCSKRFMPRYKLVFFAPLSAVEGCKKAIFMAGAVGVLKSLLSFSQYSRRSKMTYSLDSKY